MAQFSIFGGITHLIKLGMIRRRWHKIYPDSDTLPMNSFDFNHVSVGTGSYGELNILDFGGENRLIIKNYVSIAQQVTFVLNAEHGTDRISTYPFKVKTLKDADQEAFGKGDIVVDDDVWIGYGTTILSGIHIGQGAVIAAGAVVSKNVEPYSVVGGVPAKHISYRFAKETREFLLSLDYSLLSKEMIRNHIDDLYHPISRMEAKEVKESYAWFPKKNDST